MSSQRRPASVGQRSYEAVHYIRPFGGRKILLCGTPSTRYRQCVARSTDRNPPRRTEACSIGSVRVHPVKGALLAFKLIVARAKRGSQASSTLFGTRHRRVHVRQTRGQLCEHTFVGLEVPQSRNSTNRFDTKQSVMTLQDRHRRGVDLIQRDSVAQERRYLPKSSRAEQVVGTHTIATTIERGGHGLGKRNVRHCFCRRF